MTSSSASTGSSAYTTSHPDIGPVRTLRPRIEYVREPLGIDEPRPQLSWELAGSGRSRTVTAYQVRLVEEGHDPADASTPAIWDSGDVSSSEPRAIYSGPPLQPRTRYLWAVRVTDEGGRQGPWSETAAFETGLMRADQWSAQWIGSSTESPGDPFYSLDPVGMQHELARIWLPSPTDPGPVPHPPRARGVFRTRFHLPEAAVERVRLLAAGAESISAWVNGTPLPVDGSAADSAARALTAGPNTLAVQAEPSADEEPGLAARLEVQLLGEAAIQVFSSGSWRTSAQPARGWESDDYDDSGWDFAEEYGAHGEIPRGRDQITYRPSPYLRREFHLDRPVRRARLYATALGLYEAHINGQRVGADRLAPGWTDYFQRVPYQTYDVTRLLSTGDNALGAILADGWYAGNVCWYGPYQYGSRRAFLAQLEVEYADGEQVVVTTDQTWQAGAGAIQFADLQNGEVVDARNDPDGWDQPEFCEQWGAVDTLRPDHGELQAQLAPPIRVAEEIAPRSIESRGAGRYLVDFGQNLVGWVRLRANGPNGTHILMRHAEVVDHRGELYLKALRSALCTDEFFLRGDFDPELFEPRFTVHGFRYVEIIGYPGELTSSDITARVAYAGMELRGEFACSDARLNQLQSNIIWSQRGNFLTVPTDCPQRDERLGWTGDAQVFASTAAFNYDVRGFFRKWLADLRDGQLDDGAVPHVAPDVLTPNGFTVGGDGSAAAGAAGWGDAVVVVPYELLLEYGDERFAAETMDAIISWLDYLQAHCEDLIRPAVGFADWLAPTDTPRDLVQTAYFAYATWLASELAERLDRTDDAVRWRELYRRVRQAFRDHYVRGGGEVASGSQCAYVLALQFGLLEPGEEPRAAHRLVQELASRNWHLATGFLGTPFLLPVLTRAGRLDAAYRLLLQDTVPSWLYPVVYGEATTIWERWDSWSDSRGFQDPGMTSFNHYAYGAVGSWIYRTVGGLVPMEPGYRRIGFAPRPGGDLTWAAARLATPYGEAGSQWTIDGGRFTLTVTVPVGSFGEVELPTTARDRVSEHQTPLEHADGVHAVHEHDGRLVVEVGSGVYSFQVDAENLRASTDPLVR